jgi:hypothetical protein
MIKWNFINIVLLKYFLKFIFPNLKGNLLLYIKFKLNWFLMLKI